jgi:hypothetical protein
VEPLFEQRRIAREHIHDLKAIRARLVFASRVSATIPEHTSTGLRYSDIDQRFTTTYVNTTNMHHVHHIEVPASLHSAFAFIGFDAKYLNVHGFIDSSDNFILEKILAVLGHNCDIF